MTAKATPLQGATIDMHCHTTVGSGDSRLTPRNLALTARARRMTVCCITEHNYHWSQRELAEQQQAHGPYFIPGAEVSTDLGHILTFGLDHFTPDMFDARVLRRAVSAAGGIMIAAHPFRNTLINPTKDLPSRGLVFQSVREAAAVPILSLVDEVEVVNGGTDPLENYLALSVARLLGFRGVAGSDAHSDIRIGSYGTAFGDAITTERALIRALRSGRFSPQKAPGPGERLLPYTWEAASPVLEAPLLAALAKLPKAVAASL